MPNTTIGLLILWAIYCFCFYRVHRYDIYFIIFEEVYMNSKFKKFLTYYKPYKGLLFTDLVCAFIAAGITLIYPLLVKLITTKGISTETGVAMDFILKVGLVLVFLIVIEFFCNYFIAYQGHVMGAKMEFNMRNDIFTHFQKLSFNYYDNQKTGQLMSRITNDLFDVTELAHHGPEDIIISIVKIVGAFVILLNVNVTLTLIIFSILPFMVVFAFFCNKKMRMAFKQNRARISEINAQIEDSLSGIRVVKSFANEAVEIDKFYEGNSRFVSSKKDSYMYMGRFHSGLGVFTSLINLAVIVFGAIFINKGIIKITDLLTFLLYINNFVEPVRKLINFTEQFQNGATGFERFLEILAIEPDIADSENAHDIKGVKGDIDFQNVSFKYNDTTGEVLSNINLNVKAGEYMALVGPSGAGKTTICSLIPRFYEVTAGSIKLDHQDIKDIKLKSLRQNIGIVQQDVYLFAGTVLENISYGKPGASKEEIVEAAKNANAHEFIMGLPNGYDTYIGQRGIKLSGGQKQRLSIARVFLKNPPVLIFDEATSALDNESEKVVQDSLEKLAKNRTTFVIAHRLSTIKNADKILVLTDSGIEEMGTHEELLARDGVYAQLYNMQFKK